MISGYHSTNYGTDITDQINRKLAACRRRTFNVNLVHTSNILRQTKVDCLPVVHQDIFYWTYSLPHDGLINGSNFVRSSGSTRSDRRDKGHGMWQRFIKIIMNGKRGVISTKMNRVISGEKRIIVDDIGCIWHESRLVAWVISFVQQVFLCPMTT